MAETLGLRVRPAIDADLRAMEWEGEYRRFRRLYKHALDQVRRGRCLVLLAEVDGFVIGQILVQLKTSMRGLTDSSSTGYMHAFRVRPAYRNQGVGTQLVLEAESELKRRNFRWAAIAAAKDNDGARHLYERLGYSVVGEDTSEWSYIDDEGRLRFVTEPAHILEKAL